MLRLRYIRIGKHLYRIESLKTCYRNGDMIILVYHGYKDLLTTPEYNELLIIPKDLLYRHYTMTTTLVIELSYPKLINRIDYIHLFFNLLKTH